MKHIKIVSSITIFLFALSCLLFLPKVKGDVIKSKYFNYVEKGAKVVKTSPSTQYKLMETYPQATITVYNAGTTDFASLWADKDGLVIKANPFTADTDSFYYFYVDCGKYDIKFSGTGITSPYTYGDVSICGNVSSGTGNVSTLGGTTDFITKFTSSTDIGNSSLYNPSNVQASSNILIGWTSNLATDALDIALGRNAAGKIEINDGTLNSLANLTLHRIEPIPTVTIPGLNFGPIATDPSSPVAGDCWYNTSSNQFKCFNGSVVVILSTGNGITSLNGLTASVQLFAVGTSGSDFNISSSVATHTFNLPDAALTARGVVNTGSQTFNGDKIIDDTLAISSNTANAFVYSSSLKRLVTTSAPTNGQILIGSTGAAPILANITGDSNISIINTAGGIQVICTGCGGGSGTIINPTDNRLPYRQNATTFGDSNFIRRDGQILEQVNGINNPQVFRIYKTDDGIGNYERLTISTIDALTTKTQHDWILSSEKGGTGTAGDIDLIIDGFKYEFATDHLLPPTNQGQQLGSGTLRWAVLWVAQVNLKADDEIRWNASTRIHAPADGKLLVNAGSGGSSDLGIAFNDFGNGGITPSAQLHFNGSINGLESKVGDNSAFAPFVASKFCYSGTSVCDFAGNGTPEGSITANVGSTYRRLDGGAGTSFYVKESGAGNTGWTAK